MYFLVVGFRERVISSTQATADVYAERVASQERAGKPIDALDAMTAATASLFDVQIATRQVAGFTGRGVDVINPWDSVR